MSRYLAPLGFTLATLWVAVIFVLVSAYRGDSRPAPTEATADQRPPRRQGQVTAPTDRLGRAFRRRTLEAVGYAGPRTPGGVVSEHESPSAVGGVGSDGAWPSLPLSAWADTRDTLHLWTQVIGKVRLALEPMVNHWWQVPLYVNASGLTTSLMPYGDRGLEAAFDFHRHVLTISTTDGASRDVALVPRSVADFYAEVMGRLAELDVPVEIYPRPVEVPVAIPFAEDEEHAEYDAGYAHRFWLSLVHTQRVLTVFRGRFTGKVSPVHFFWGAFDLAVTRFSGRTAPPHPGGIPNTPDAITREAYSHEVSSCGYWPGGAEQGLYYSYAYPEPAGFSDRPVAPAHASYDGDLREFVLPYHVVRSASDPDAMLLAFAQSTYEAAAELAGWDRAAIERTVTPP